MPLYHCGLLAVPNGLGTEGDDMGSERDYIGGNCRRVDFVCVRERGWWKGEFHLGGRQAGGRAMGAICVVKGCSRTACGDEKKRCEGAVLIRIT